MSRIESPSYNFDPSALPQDERFAVPNHNTPDPSREIMSIEEIKEASREGSILLSRLFGIERKEAEEKLENDFAYIAENYWAEPGTKFIAIPGITLGEEGGQWISPSQLIKACDRQYNIRDLKPLAIWEDMFITDRSASWWNKTRPDGSTPNIGELGVHGLLVVDELKGTDMALKSKVREGLRPIVGQQEHVEETVSDSIHNPIAEEILSIPNWLMIDQLAIQKGEERPNTTNVCRFIQHPIDRKYLRDGFSPSARVSDGRAKLSGSKGKDGKNVGYYTVLGRNSFRSKD